MTYDAEGVIKRKREDGRRERSEEKEEPRTRRSRGEETTITQELEGEEDTASKVIETEGETRKSATLGSSDAVIAVFVLAETWSSRSQESEAQLSDA
ncbi:hypothetical protein NDU88_006441 [Pleurodeles waltl]|uniref:Uncharacterized protein n=1 Tax=Pleurodeles waltl TaxID=8319 RepID=A0AAV7RP09_PLEWA|nr:hypothetical protein NDU88_006441 [Pleurodeles waltl]